MSSDSASNDVEGRRPLKVRQMAVMNKIAVWLSNKDVTPNQISIASVAFAALAALSLVLLPLVSNISDYGSVDYAPDTASWLLPILAALFIQCRLLCNLFDGMVAVEGGKSTPAGELFNDIPDRVADPLILIAAAYSISVVAWAPTLGWCAGLLAVMTAYIRTLAVSIGAPADFQGPMAKQHRMALMTVASLLTAVETNFWSPGMSMLIVLVVMVIGCGVTIYRRTKQAYLFLENQ